MSTSLEDVMAALGVSRAESLQSAVTAQVKQIQEQNAKLAFASELMSRLQNPSYVVPPSAVALCTRYGIRYLPGDRKQTIENLKNFINQQSAQSQMSMLQMQNLINRRSQTIQLVSNIMKKESETRSSIIQNIR
jgi:hypothetical protein